MKPGKAFNIALTVLSLLLIAGLAAFFKPCGPREDGSYMSCHYAGLYSQAAAAMLFAQSVSALILHGSGRSRGIFISMLVVEVLLFLIPGTIVGLCMMPDMRCRMLMRPFIMVMDVVIAVITLICVILAGREKAGHSTAGTGGRA